MKNKRFSRAILLNKFSKIEKPTAVLNHLMCMISSNCHYQMLKHCEHIVYDK